MLKNLDKNLLKSIFNSNEFKGWLLSRRWFGDKYSLSNLEFEVSFLYFENISERIFLTVIEIKTTEYSKSYFLPLIYYKKIKEILEPSEDQRNNILMLTENTFSKKVVMNIDNVDKIFTLNLIEAEYCILFWRKMLFEKEVTELFPKLSLELMLYTDQFKDEISMEKVQNLIEASLYPDRYSFSIEQLGKGNTTNLLFKLNLYNIKAPEKKPLSYVFKSYKVHRDNVEPSILKVLVKNNFPNAPKIYGMINVAGKETIGIIEYVPTIGNLGDIYWKEVNNMIETIFKDLNKDFSEFQDKSAISAAIKDFFDETLKVSEEVGIYINKLHESLILAGDINYNLEEIESNNYLNTYTENLKAMLSSIQNDMTQYPENHFYNSPKINSILIDIKDIIDKFRSEFKEDIIKVQPVHQDLHMEQILVNKSMDRYQFYFIDFEGDPQLTIERRKGKFPIEKDIASILRALSYIKFNTFLSFIEKNFIKRNKFEVAEEILYSFFFRKAAKNKYAVLEVVLRVLNVWEEKLITKIIKILNPNIILTNYFTIERALYELHYEILFRPREIIIPILGLKEIIDKY